MEESNETIVQRTSQQNQSPSNNIEQINEESVEPSYNIEESNEQIIDLVGTVKEAEDSNISPCTRRIYINKLIEIMIHLFDTSQCKLAYLEELVDAHESDILLPVRSQKKRSNLKKECKRQIEAMSRDLKNPPIRLEGSDALNYDDISRYMNAKKTIVRADKQLVRRMNTENDEGDDNNNTCNTVKVAVRCSGSTYTQIASSIAFLYREVGIDRPQELKDRVSVYCKGSKRRGRRLKQNLGLKIREGKKELSFRCFKLIAKKLFESDKKEDVFNHTFFLLDW